MTTKGKRWIRGSLIGLIGLLAWGVWVLPAFSEELTEIEVERVKNDTNVIIRGGYSSYRAFTLPKPARLVIDFEGTRRGTNLPLAQDVGGAVLSKIRVGEGQNRVRVVLDSSRKDEPFHFNIGEEDGAFRLRCWRPEASATATTESAAQTVTDRSGPVTAGFPEQALRDVLGLSLQDTSAEEPEGQRVPKYPGEKIHHIDFYQEDLHNVFRLFGELFGKNFIVDDSVKGTLTLSLKDVPWDLAMDIIADMKDLEIVERADILVVRPREEKTEGDLVVKSVSDEALHPARILKKQKEDERKARELILKGHNLEKEGRLEEALQSYENAYDAWKGNIDLTKKTAHLHYRLERYARSYFFAKEALKLNMQDAEAALYAALSAAQMDKNDEAQLFFEAAINGKPKLPEAYFNCALFLEQIGKFTDSIHVYQKHEETFGPSLDVSLAIAKLYEAKNRNTEACRHYRKISFSGFPMDEATEIIIQQKVDTLCD
ncbi:MAG: AMIN domain-containing protein [Thermodesulfobacteriota bacterium]